MEDLVEPWADELDPTEDAMVHLVQPQPPCTLAECVLAHLVIEQSHRPQHGVGLLSKSGYDRANRGSNIIVHRAFSLPHLMNAALILRYIDLYDTCMNQFCRIRRGQVPFNMFEWEELPRACCLTTYYDRSMAEQRVDVPESDSVELLQRFSSSTCSPQAGIDLTPSAAQCERFQFNPNAPVFVPNAPTAPQPPARWLELYRHWTRLAFSWEDEASSVTFLTWFVDQYNPALRRCAQPRRVSLTEDFRSWDAALRQAWPDRAVSGAPFNIHVVAPQPPSSTAEEIVHVLLVQNPQDGLSTTLITAYDHDRGTEDLSFQLAFTANAQFLLDHLILGLGLTHRCLPSGRPMQCQAWYDQTPILLGWPIWLTDGSGIIFHLGSTQQVDVPADDMTLLQLGLHQKCRKVELQLDSLIPPSSSSATTCERLTTVTVAHEQWPQDGNSPQPTAAVRLKAGPGQLPLSDFLEVPAPITESLVEAELLRWGHHCLALRFGGHDEFLCLPAFREPGADALHIMYCTDEGLEQDAVILHTHVGPAPTDLEHMKLLHKFGFMRTAIVRSEQLFPDVLRVVFVHHQPELAPRPNKLRIAIHLCPHRGLGIATICGSDCSALIKFLKPVASVD